MKKPSPKRNSQNNTDTVWQKAEPKRGAICSMKVWRRALTVACLSPLLLAAMCKTPPSPSKATYLEIAMEATAPKAPRPDCVTNGPPDARPFPTPNKVDIVSPESVIQQGHEYGETLVEARNNHHFREGQIDAFAKTCRDGFTARQKRHDSQTETRQKLIDEMNKPAPKWWWPF